MMANAQGCAPNNLIGGQRTTMMPSLCEAGNEDTVDGIPNKSKSF
jgi:hypothetical protein